MYIIVDDIFLFDVDTWGEVASRTWGDISITTWQELANFSQNGMLMADPKPSIHHVVEDRSTAEFHVLDVGGLYHFEKGQQVTCYSSDDFSIIFGGFIDSATEYNISSHNIILHEITCADNHYLADKRIIAKAWENTTIEAAVQYIVDNILQFEGITVGSIQTAGTLQQYVAAYISCSECLDKLAELAGFTWWISEDKKLYFVDRTAYDADWDLLETASGIVTDAEYGSLKVTHGNPEYRNKQYLTGGFAKTSVQTEYFAGDGTQQTFVVGYNIEDEPTLYVRDGVGEYVLKTVGVKGTDTGKDFYWSKSDNTITQELSATALTSSQKLKVVYTGLYPIVAVSANYGEIDDRADKEGSSGIVEMVASDSNVLSMASALEKINAILSHYASLGKKIEYKTTRSGLACGTLQHITLPKHDVDDDCLIGSIDIEFDVVDYYNVSAYTGPVEDSWTKIFFANSQAQSQSDNASGSIEVLLVSYSFTKNWTSSETPNIWKEVLPSSSTLPSDQWFPCFDNDDRIKYLALYFEGNEVYRIYKTAQTMSDTQIITTFIIPSSVANQSFDNAKLVGGDNATSTALSGTVVETHPFPYTKNNLESLQLQFTSNKYEETAYSYTSQQDDPNARIKFTSLIGAGVFIQAVEDVFLLTVDNGIDYWSVAVILGVNCTASNAINIINSDSEMNTTIIAELAAGSNGSGIVGDIPYVELIGA